MRIKLLILFTILGLALPTGLAQNKYSLNKEPLFYDIKELSHVKNIQCVFKDKTGYIWIGTQNGLFKFDGYTAKHFRYDPSEPYKLAGNIISCITEDNDRNIWIGLFGIGLQKYDPIKDAFTLFKAEPLDSTKLIDNRIIQLYYHEKKIWIRTQGGVCRLSLENNIYKRFTLPSNLWFENDNSGNIWVYDRNNTNIFKYDRISDSFIVYDSLRHENMYLLAVIDDKLVFGSFNSNRGDRLYSYNGISKKLEFIAIKKKYPIINWIVVNNKIIFFGEDIIESFDLVKNKFTILLKDRKLKDILSSSESLINPLILDSSYMLLMGFKAALFQYGNAGIEKYSLLNGDNKLAIMPKLMYSLNDNQFGIGKSIIVDVDMKKLIPISSLYHSLAPFAADYIYPRPFLSQCIDKESNHWFVLANNTVFNTGILPIYRFNPEKKELKQIDTINVRTVLNLFGGMVKDSNILWIAFWNGLVKYNLSNRRYDIIKDSKDSTGLCSKGIRCIFLDSDGDLWIGTEGGLNRKMQDKNYFIHYQSSSINKNSLVCNSVSTICEDKNGIIWIGTSGGLNAFNKKTNLFKSYNIKDGLLEDNLSSIEIQNDQTIWVSNDIGGISHLDPKTNRIINYGVKDGISDNPLLENASTTLSDGSMIFAGEGTLNRIYPNRLIQDSSKTPILITDIQLFNKSVDVNGADSILHNNISVTKAITFKYDENVITILYTALDYIENEYRTYAYILEGFDKEWQYVGQKREVTFTNLSSGTYTFRVKSSNRYGIWQEADSPLNITILPPWWQTWWAYLLYALGIALSLRVYIQYRSRLLKEKNIVLEEKVLQRTNELEKSLVELKLTQTQLIQKEKMASLGELTAGIAHEIQNPLNFVNNFSELNNELIKELEEETRSVHRDTNNEEDLLN